MLLTTSILLIRYECVTFFHYILLNFSGSTFKIDPQFRILGVKVEYFSKKILIVAYFLLIFILGNQSMDSSHKWKNRQRQQVVFFSQTSYIENFQT